MKCYNNNNNNNNNKSAIVINKLINNKLILNCGASDTEIVLQAAVSQCLFGWVGGLKVFTVWPDMILQRTDVSGKKKNQI